MQEQQVQISMDEKTAGGVYSNVAVISHNENEFILDFIFVQPPIGKVNSRVIMSPSHAKRFLKALEQNIAMQESKHGVIKESKDPPMMGLNFNLGKN